MVMFGEEQLSWRHVLCSAFEEPRIKIQNCERDITELEESIQARMIRCKRRNTQCTATSTSAVLLRVCHRYDCRSPLARTGASIAMPNGIARD